MFKTYKLSKRLLSKHPVELLKAYGLVDEDKRACYPERCYLSKQDSNKLKDTIKRLAKKECKGYTDKHISKILGYEWLCYGTNSSLEEVIRPGYVVIFEEN